MNNSVFLGKDSASHILIKQINAMYSEFGDDILSRAVAEVTHARHLGAWIEKNNLTRSRGRPCVFRLLGRRCSGDCRQGFGAGNNGCLPPGTDHVSLWNKGGKPHVFVSQPYGLTSNDINGLVEFCDDLGLEVNISTWPAWHFPGRVLNVEIKRQA